MPDPESTEDLLVRIRRTLPKHTPLAHEAADEIERLRARIAELEESQTTAIEPLEFDPCEEKSEFVSVAVAPGMLVRLLIARLSYHAEDTCPKFVRLSGLRVELGRD